MPVLRVDVDERQIVLHTEGALCATTQELVESEAFARVVELYVAHLEAHNPEALDALGLSGEPRSARLADRAAAPARQQPARPGRARLGRAGRPARAPRSACTSSSRASTTSGAASTASWSPLADPRGRADAALPRLQPHHRVARAASCARSTATWSRTSPAPPARLPSGGGRLRGRPGRRPRRAAARRRRTATCSADPLHPPRGDGSRRSSSTRPRTRAPAIHRGRRQSARRPPARAERGSATRRSWARSRSSSTSTSASSGWAARSPTCSSWRPTTQIAAGPDAVYLYGVPPEALARFGELPTVFYDDAESGLLVAAVPPRTASATSAISRRWC